MAHTTRPSMPLIRSGVRSFMLQRNTAEYPPGWNPSIYCHYRRATHCGPPRATLRVSNPRRSAPGLQMIPLYYMDETVRRRAKFAEKGNGGGHSHASSQKMALVSVISRRRDSPRGEEGS